MPSNIITRESLISSDIVKVAISKETMFDVSKDGESVVEVPIPESIKTTGIITVSVSKATLFPVSHVYITTTIAVADYRLHPALVVATLAKNNMTTIESVPRPCLLFIFPLQNS